MLKDALLLTAANFALRIMTTVFQVFLSNRMGAGTVGLLQLVTSVGTLAGTLASSGVRVAAMYLCAGEFGHGRPGGAAKAVSCCLRYGLVASALAAALLYGLSAWLAAHWVRDPAALLSLRVFALTLPGMTVFGVLSGYFTACGRVRELVRYELLERSFGIGVTLLLLLRADRDPGLAVAAVILGGNGAYSAVCLPLYARYRKLTRALERPRGDRMGSRLLRVSVPLALNDYLRSGLSALEQFLIPYGLAKTESRAAGMAEYGVVVGMAYPVILFPAALLWSVADLLVPELARCQAQRDTRRAQAVTDRVFRLCTLFAAAAAGVFFCAGEGLGALLYREGAAGRYLRLYAPMVLFLYLDMIVDGMHKGLGQQVPCVRYNTFTNVLDVIGLYLFVPRFGVAGYLGVYCVTHLVNFFLSLRRLLVVTGFAPNLRRLAGTFGLLCACAAPWALPTFSSPWLGTLLPGLGFLAAFLSGCFLFGLLTNEDRAWLRRSLPHRKTSAQPPACHCEERSDAAIRKKKSRRQRLTFSGSVIQ